MRHSFKEFNVDEFVGRKNYALSDERQTSRFDNYQSALRGGRVGFGNFVLPGRGLPLGAEF